MAYFSTKQNAILRDPGRVRPEADLTASSFANELRSAEKSNIAKIMAKNGYEVQEVVEPNSTKPHRIYTYNGKPCRRIKMDTRLCNQLAGYALIEKDLRSARIWLSEIDELRKDEVLAAGSRISRDRKTYNVVKGLFVAALTFYGKCFSKCDGRPVKIEKNQLDEKFRVVHDEIIRFRHNFAAHSGAERIEYVEIALVIPRAKNNLALPNLYRELFQPDLMFGKLGDVSFTDTVEHARQIVLKKIDLLSKKIMDEEVYPKGREYWLKK